MMENFSSISTQQSAAAMTVAAEHPDKDHVLSRIGETARNQFFERLNLMQLINRDGGTRKAALSLARHQNISGNTAYQLYRRWIKSNQDWWVLIDRRHCADLWQNHKAALPPNFIRFWKQLCDENQRKIKPAHRKLVKQLRRWRDGETCAIPGYDAPPPNATGSHLPKGWTYENLLSHAPTKTEREATRGGRFRASLTLPGVRRTRVGSYPMQEVQFDDMWHDLAVIAEGMGQRSARRLLQFGAVDMFTTYLFDPGLKPRIKDAETGRNKILNERDFLFYLLWFLTDVGWHPEGTTLILENGTATVRGDFADKLLNLTQGLVTVRTGAMSGRSAIAGGYGERAKGNPRFKALKEGLGSLAHNELADLPGQIGMSRDHMPQENFGRHRAADELIAIAAVYPELADKLQYPFLTLSQAREAILGTYRHINARTDHSIEGWEEAGLLHQEWRIESNATEWLPMSRLDNLPAARRDMMLEVLAADPECQRTRRLSPTEVMTTRCPKLHKLNAHGLTTLLPQDFFQVRSVRQRLIEFEDADLGPGKHRFLARVQDEAGRPLLLKDGEKFGTCVNPYNPDQMLVVDARGAFVGVCDRYRSVQAGDVEGMHRAHGRAQRIYNEATADLAARSGGELSNLQRHNARVIRNHIRKQDAAAPQGLNPSDLLGSDEPTEAEEDFRPSMGSLLEEEGQ